MTFTTPFSARWALCLLVGILSGACTTRPTTQAPKADPPESRPHIPEKRAFPVETKVPPCRDFYEHACARVSASFHLPEDRSYHVFAFSDSSERILEKKKSFLSGLAGEKNLGPHGQTLRTIYLSCMDESASGNEERQLVRRIVDETARVADHAAFQQFLGEKILSEDYSFLTFGSLPSHDDPRRYDLYVTADLQTLPERSYYDNAEVMKDFQALLTTFFTAIGKDRPAERAWAVADFEKASSRTYPLPAEFRVILNRRSGIKRTELTSRYPNLRLASLLDKVPAKTHLRHLTPAHFAWLNDALRETPLETLKDTYLFHANVEHMDDAFPEFQKQRFAFAAKHLGGPAVRPDRHERCTKLVMEKFPKEIDAELIPRLFPDFPEERFRSMAEKVRAAILRGLQNNEWLSYSARRAAMRKIRVARLQLVKPSTPQEWDFNPPVDYTVEKPYGNVRALRLALMNKTLRELSEGRDPDRWEMGPLTVNAYYSPPDNKFVMPIGILQYPFFDPASSDETNLGAVGAVIGHELGHAIDDKGSLYDENGKLRQWMGPFDLREFHERGKWLKRQFQAAGADGELTLGENIGDLVGLTFAYQAAFPRNRGTKQAKQEFFLQYARLWCHVVRPKFQEMLLKVDPHAPGRLRVNEQVVHQDGFQEAFACKPGDKLYRHPRQRLRIW